MRTGVVLSGIVHGGVLLAAIIGLPWFERPEPEPIKVAEVELIDAREFDSRNAEEEPQVFAEDFEMSFDDTGGEVGETPELELEHTGAITDEVEAPSARDKQADLTALLEELAQPEVAVQVTEIDETTADPLGGLSMEGMSFGAETAALPGAGLSRPQLGGPVAPAPFAPPALPASATRSDRQETPEETPEETPIEETPPEEPVEETPPEEPEVAEDENPNQLQTSARPVVRPRDFADRLAEAEAAETARQEEAARAEAEAAERRAEAEEAARQRQAEADRRADEVQRAAEAAERERLEREAAELEERQRAEDEALAAEIAAAAAAAAEAEAEAADAGAAAGPPMTAGEKDALKFAVQKCWNPPNGLADAGSLKVTLAVRLNPDGTLIGQPELIDPPSITSSDIEIAFEAARRAIIRCGARGYDLPREKYEQWKNLEVVFNPQGVLGF